MQTPTSYPVWILVSDAGHARLFAIPKRDGALTLLQDIPHPEGRLHGMDITEDKPGRQHQRSPNGEGSRSGMEPHTDPKETIAIQFARSLVDLLEKGRVDNAFTSLVLVAPPHFLGLLRTGLGAQLKKLLVTSVDKDYTQLKQPELEQHIAQL